RRTKGRKSPHSPTREGCTMAILKCRALLMDYEGRGENSYDFEADADIMEKPADEVVEVFVREIERRGILTGQVRYELNAATRFPNGHEHLVGAVGSLMPADGRRIPFVLLIDVKPG